MTSSTSDGLRILYSDLLDISDKDYGALSEILSSHGHGAEVMDNGLAQILYILWKNNEGLPLSIGELQGLWRQEFPLVNFIQTILPLVKDGTLKVHKTGNFDQTESALVLGSSTFDSIRRGFFEIFDRSRKKSPAIGVYESVQGSHITGVPKNVTSIADRLNNSLSRYAISTEVESYMKDESGSEEINLVFTGVSDYNANDKEIQRRANALKKVSFVNDVEAYKEGRSELYVGVSLSKSPNSYGELVSSLANLILQMELEIGA